MFCPECSSEFRQGFTTCTDCGVALVWQVPAERGDRDSPLTPLAHESSPELVAELLDRLEREGIPYVIQAGTAIAVFEDERTDLDRPLPWEARLWVLTTREGRARRILSDIREQLLAR